jgi:hypothetical protein
MALGRQRRFIPRRWRTQACHRFFRNNGVRHFAAALDGLASLQRAIASSSELSFHSARARA